MTPTFLRLTECRQGDYEWEFYPCIVNGEDIVYIETVRDTGYSLIQLRTGKSIIVEESIETIWDIFLE